MINEPSNAAKSSCQDLFMINFSDKPRQVYTSNIRLFVTDMEALFLKKAQKIYDRGVVLQAFGHY